MATVKIYTTTICPYCNAVKSLFKNIKVEFEEINLDNNQTLREKLSKENNGWRTVPMVFIDKTFIGGYDDTSKMLKDGSLFELLGIKKID